MFLFTSRFGMERGCTFPGPHIQQWWVVVFFGVVVIKMQESTRKPQAHDLNGGDIHPCHWTESL